MFAERSTFPDLPTIAHGCLAKRVFTHPSASPLRDRSRTLSLGPTQYPFPDNSKLEHIGDSIIGAHVTLLLQEIACSLQEGPATELKALLVSNKHLASLATTYGLDKLIITAPSARHTVVSEPGSRAGAFEAYVAGVYYDFFATTPLPELKPKTERTHGDAFAYVGAWLRPLFRATTSSAHSAILKRKVEEVFADEVGEDDAAVGATALLNQWVMQRTGGLPNYAFLESGMRHECTCTVSMASQTYTASATRNKKKSAMSVAAWRVGLDLGLV